MAEIKVTTSFKGLQRVPLWIVHLPDGSTRGFSKSLFTKEEAITAATQEKNDG